MQLIVCEQTGDWASALRRRLPDVSILETRSLFEIWDRLEADSGSIVAIEFSLTKAEGILVAIVRMNRNFPFARCIVLLPRTLHAWEQVVREAGAVHVVLSPRTLGEIGGLLQRHGLNSPATTPSGRASASLKEEILATLPWSE